MVNPMHVRSYYKKSQAAVHCFGNPDVAVVEPGSSIQHRRKDNYRHDWRPNQGYCRQLDPDGYNYFDRMETIACSDVDIKVGVMHPVEAPENRQKMEEHMLEINDKVEDHDSQGILDPAWQVDDIQDAPPAFLSEQ